MDHSDHQHAQKNEPSLDPAKADELPAWLNKPAEPTAGQRWGRRVLFLGASLLTVAVAAGATMLALDLYESTSSMEVVAASSQAEVARATAPATSDALPFVDKRTSSLPPLVLLPQDPNAAKKKEAATAAAAAAAAAAATTAAGTTAVAPAVTAPPERAAAAPKPALQATPEPEKAVVAPPLVARKLEKPVPAVVAVRKDPAPAVATVKPVKVAVKPPKKIAAKPTPQAIAKKAAAQAKRIATPALAKAQPRVTPIKGKMLPPPRERGLDPVFQDPPRQAIDRRCRPGELARECEARTR